jgi:hypothetical protein
MTRAGAEVRERHPVAASDARVHLMDLAREAVRRQPLGHRVGIEEGAIQAIGGGAQHAVEADGVGGLGHGRSPR